MRRAEGLKEISRVINTYIEGEKSVFKETKFSQTIYFVCFVLQKSSWGGKIGRMYYLCIQNGVSESKTADKNVLVTLFGSDFSE